MCDVLDRVENKGRVEGRAEGRVEGRQEGEMKAKKESAINFAKMSIPVETIAKGLNVSVEQVMKWLTPASA